MSSNSGSGKGSSSDPHGIAQVLADLQKQYIQGLPGKADNIEKLWAQKQIQEIETEFHKLKGTGKTYGLPEISQVGEVAEALCEANIETLAQALPLAVRLLRKVHQLRTASETLRFDLREEADFQQLERLRAALGKGLGPQR
jgi:HPt (histidine-containing phosphotransfer) domain-containing protein